MQQNSYVQVGGWYLPHEDYIIIFKIQGTELPDLAIWQQAAG